jgi:branched-chain amino acid transport system substrate-binding protein
MLHRLSTRGVGRRSVLKAGLALGAAPLAGPFIINARGEEPVRIGLDDPLTGTYAQLGKNERIGCELAVEQINAKGGILGRQVELLVEDSTSGDVGTAVQKARKLMDRDKVSFLLGNVNSSMALALGQAANELNTLLIVPGGHTDAVTGKDCHWNVFRVCNTTRMETNSVSKTLFDQFGKKWFFITADYAFGHTLQQGFEASLKQFGGTEAGVALTPLGTPDFSSHLSGPGRPTPAIILLLNAGGGDQLVEAGGAVRSRQAHIAGAAGARVLRALPPEADRHLGVRMVLEAAGRSQCQEFVDAIKGQDQRVPTAPLVQLSPRLGPAPSSPIRKTLEARSSPRRWRLQAAAQGG